MLVHDSTVSTDLHGLSAVPLLRRHELDAAVAVPMVVPVDERGDPLTGLLFGSKGLAGVIRPILHCPEQRFRVRVVVRHPWPGEGSEDTQFLQPAFQRGRTHGVAVIGVQDQRLLSHLGQKSNARAVYLVLLTQKRIKRLYNHGFDIKEDG